MLVILSTVSVASANVRDEISYALDRQKRIIPVLVSECEIPIRLSRLQHIDFRADYARGLRFLLRSLGVETGFVPSGLSLKVAASYRNALAGNTHDMVEVGLAYENGNGAPQDYKQAAYWYRKAADAGDNWGMADLGVSYSYGHGLPQDDEQAVYWLRKSADAGNTRGMVGLGVMYEKGRGSLRQDYQQAVYWYRRSADAGDSQGMNNVGKMYEDGYGVQKDKRQAIDWYRKAANLGNQGAKDALKRLGENP